MIFKVEFKRTAHQFATLEVEAASEKEARLEAGRQMTEDEWDCEWQIDGTSPPVIHWVGTVNFKGEDK